MEKYHNATYGCSRFITKHYSTSFSMGVRLLHKLYREAIYAIYGFVRLGDEVVDSFHEHDQKKLFEDFKKETYKAIEEKVSINPVLHSFQLIVHKYQIHHELIDAFLTSMEMDLHIKKYSEEEFSKYVYGSAEVVGLMCLKVFYKNDEDGYKRLIYPARKLGEAFQKINFLRDIKHDYIERGRIYFPNVDFNNFSIEDKKIIEGDIENDFNEAYDGIIKLNKHIRLGVYVSYIYFFELFKKIKKTDPVKIINKRYRISNGRKIWLFIKSYLVLTLGLYKKSDTTSLNLNTEIDEQSGFCFGVINAVEKAEEVLDREGKLYCLGEIVHNEEEIRRLSKKGLITIKKDELKKLRNKRILFRAHGEPPSSYETVFQNDNELIDASCPIILGLQEQIKNSFDHGETIFIYGKKNHPETIGLNGQINNKALVFENIEELETMDLPSPITLFSQTTMDVIDYKNIIKYLKEKGIDVKANNSICKNVTKRRDTIGEFCEKFEKVIFVAGKKSSNGKVLFESCKLVNSNTYYISSKEEIRKDWFCINDNVGICGATSTPMWLMKEVKDLLNSY